MRTRRRAPRHHRHRQLRERPTQALMFRTRQQLRQLPQRPRNPGHRPLFQRNLRRHHVPDRQILHPERVLVNQQMALLRLVGRQRRTHRRHRLRHLQRRRPPALPVVDHDGQHRRQLAVRRQPTAADQLQVHLRRVGQDPRRHVAVDAGLELQQHQQIEPVFAAAPEAHPPDRVGAPAAAAVAAGIFAGHRFEGGEIQRRRQLRRGEAAQQVLDHPLVVEPALERRVVTVARRHSRTGAQPAARA